MARELVILPRFKRDYRSARRHPDFDIETLEYVFDLLISGDKLPAALREHRLSKSGKKWTASPSAILDLIFCSFIEYVGVR